jgi:hypothetical protein
MAIHMALYGGLGIIHCNNTIEGASRPARFPPPRDCPTLGPLAAQSNATR